MAHAETAPVMSDTAMTPEATIGAIVAEPAPTVETPTVETPTVDESAPIASAAAAYAVAQDTMVHDRAGIAEAAIAGAADPVSAEPGAAETSAEQPVSGTAAIPVMDPSATADSSWPAPEPEPEPVAASVDHQSAAVRLLRSVAPWTAPTHAGSGSNDRSESE